jgi:hypothetical protein
MAFNSAGGFWMVRIRRTRSVRRGTLYDTLLISSRSTLCRTGRCLTSGIAIPDSLRKK